MNMGCLFICLDLPSSLSAMFCGFQHTNLSLPLLDLFFLSVSFLFFKKLLGMELLNFLFRLLVATVESTTDFRVLIFYPVTLLNLYVCSRSFLVDSLGFF